MDEAVKAIEQRLAELCGEYQRIASINLNPPYYEERQNILDIIKIKMIECETVLRFIKPENNYLDEN